DGRPIQHLPELFQRHQTGLLALPDHCGGGTAYSLGPIEAGAGRCAPEVAQPTGGAPLPARLPPATPTHRRSEAPSTINATFRERGLVAAELVGGMHQPDPPIRLKDDCTGSQLLSTDFHRWFVNLLVEPIHVIPSLGGARVVSPGR